MDQLLKGNVKAAVKHRQKKWRLSPNEWETLAKLCDVLKVCEVEYQFLLFTNLYNHRFTRMLLPNSRRRKSPLSAKFSLYSRQYSNICKMRSETPILSRINLARYTEDSKVVWRWGLQKSIFILRKHSWVTTPFWVHVSFLNFPFYPADFCIYTSLTPINSTQLLWRQIKIGPVNCNLSPCTSRTPLWDLQRRWASLWHSRPSCPKSHAISLHGCHQDHHTIS